MPRTDTSQYEVAWGTAIVMMVLLLVLGHEIIGEAFDDPSWWNLTMLVVWGVVVSVHTTTMVNERRTGGRRHSNAWTDSLAIVFADEVAHAVATTTTRIDAIDALRRRNPGLRRQDAAALIDSALAPPDPPAP